MNSATLRPGHGRLRRLLVAVLAAVVVTTGLPAVPNAPQPVQAVEPGNCQIYQGQFYITPCPEYEAIHVAGATQWGEGFTGALKQYWVGATIDWGRTISATANCSDSTTSVTWGLWRTDGNSRSEAQDTSVPMPTGESVSIKIRESVVDVYGLFYLQVAAECHGGELERNDPSYPVQGWTFIRLQGIAGTPRPPANENPTATCTATQTGPAGRYHFVADASDPDGDALTYTWDYGDGTPTEGGDNRTHDYALPGPFAAKVTVTDGNGGSDTGDCPVDVPAPTLGLAIELVGKDDGRVELDETFTVRLHVSASADGVGSLTDLAFVGDPLRVSPDGHLELVEPVPDPPDPFSLTPGGPERTLDYDVHVTGLGLATLLTRLAGKDAAGRDIDTADVTRNVSAPALKVTITAADEDIDLDAIDLDADSDGNPEPQEFDVTITVENVTDETVDAVVLGPLDLAAADPARTYDPFPAEVLGANVDEALGAFAAHENKETTRRLKVTADGRITATALATSSSGNGLGEAEIRSDVQTLLRMTIDGNATRLVNAGSAVTFFGRFTNVTNERTVAITDPMKVRRTGNLVGGGFIAQADGVTEGTFPPPLISVLEPGESVEFQVPLFTERPTVSAYDDGTASLDEWTEAAVDFNVWIRAAVEEEDETWQALSTEEPCTCEYPASVVIEGGDLGAFDIEIDTTERVSDGARFESAAFGFSVGALEGAQNRLSGLLGLATDVGRFVFSQDFRDQELSREQGKGRLRDALDYLAEFAVWLPATEQEQVVSIVAGNLASAFGAFDREVSGGLARIPESKTEAALRAMAEDYFERLQGAWRRGDPNELIDAVMPAGGIVGEQVTDMLVGEAVFEALAHLATVPRYYALAKENWADAKTIAQMQAKLPSLAQQADELAAHELSKSNFINLENAYQTRRELTIPELGGAENGAGLARDTIQTAMQWTTDNPNQIIVLLPNEPATAALRDAGLAVGKIENLKPKSLPSIEYLVFGGRAEDRNVVVLRNLDHWNDAQVNSKVDELIAAGELTEQDRAVAKQILNKRKSEWKVFNDRGIKDPVTGEVTPDKDGIWKIKAYDETGKIPNQFRGEDNGITFSGPEQQLDFKLEYYKDGQLLPASRINEADYVVPLQEHPTNHNLVKVTGDDDGLFMGKANGLGLPTEQLEAAYASVWQAFNHPFSDTWLARTTGELKAKLKIFSRYFTVTSEGTGGAPLVAAMNGKFYAVKIDPWLSRFDPGQNRAFIKWVGLPQAVDPVNPGGWVNAVLRPVANIPWPATFLRSFLHIPGAATNPDIPPIPTAKRARVLRVNETGAVESWTPTTGWQLNPTAQAEAEAGTVAVAPQTLLVEAVEAGAVRIEITSQADMGFAGEWFEIGDLVVLDPGGENEETATISGFGSLIFEGPLQFSHAPGTLVTLLPPAAPETTITGGPAAVTRSTEATFEFEADAEGATFECRVDDGEWSECVSPFETDDESDGPHTFAVRASVGDEVEPDPAIRTWRIDTHRPTIAVVVPGVNLVVERGATVPTEFSCADVGGSGVASCTGSSGLDTGTLGTKTVTVVATDAAGNRRTVNVAYRVVEPQCTACRILVSRTPSRAAPRVLDGATLVGPLYIFISADPSIRSVRFSLDGGRYAMTDSSAPWDLVPLGLRALPVPSLLLGRGRHALAARLTLANGTTRTLTATFTIGR